MVHTSLELKRVAFVGPFGSKGTCTVLYGHATREFATTRTTLQDQDNAHDWQETTWYCLQHLSREGGECVRMPVETYNSTLGTFKLLVVCCGQSHVLSRCFRPAPKAHNWSWKCSALHASA
jgi:hypothetical protein